MALEASDAISPLTKEGSITTKCMPKMDIPQVVKSNTKRLAEIKVWGDGQEIGSNVFIIMEIKRPHTLSEGDQWVTLLREQHDGERYSGGLKGRRAVSPEVGAEGVFALQMLETHNSKMWKRAQGHPCQMAAEGVMRMSCSLQLWRTWENGGRVKWREELEEVKYTVVSQVWLHSSTLTEIWDWFSA